LSNDSTHGLPTGAVTSLVVNWMPCAAMVTFSAFAGAEASGDAPPDACGLLNSSAQHAGYGVAPGAGL
jgi:hypothetical protein